MAGMEYTFSADVAPFVGALDAAIGAAKRFESAVHGARDAEMELGASGAEAAAGLAAQTAAMDAAASSADRLNRQHRLLGTALRDSERVARDAGIGIGDLEKAAGNAASSGGGLSRVGGMLSSLGTPALWTGIAGLAAGATPAILSLGAGFASFGALAAPALYKVKTGLTQVTAAQQAYQSAKAIEKRDPTTAHLAAEQRALLKLKTTWAQMPAPVRGAVSEIRQFGRAWSEASRRSGIQKAALGDIRLAIRDARALIPTITGLARAAQPIIHGMLGGLGREFKSKGFTDFIGTLKKDMGPAAHALKGIGSAVGGFITQLTKRESGPGTQMLTNIGKFLKTITPGVVTGLTGLTKGISGFFSTMTKVASSGAVSNLVGDVEGMFRGIHNVAHDFNSGASLSQIFHDVVHFGDKPQVAKIRIAAQVTGVKGREQSLLSSLGFKQGILGGKAGAATVTVKVKPKIDSSNFGKELDASQQLKAHAAAVHVRVKADGGDIKKQISDAAKTGGNIPVKGRVTLTGLAAGIKSQIANLKIPSSKVKISVSVAGVGSAKAAMASVVGAARKDAAAAAAALNSLGAAGAAAGRALDQGLAGGILAGESGVVSAAAQVAGAAAAAARKAAGIASPSKVWHGIGRNMIQGLLLGLQGGKAQVQAAARAITGAAAPFKDASITSTIRKLREDVRKAFKAGDIGKHQRDGLIDFIDHGNQRLMHLAQQRAKIMGQIRAATALAKSVTQGAIASADITGIAGTIAGDKNTGKAAPTIQEAQKEQLGKIRQFTHAIKQLKREGLDRTSIKQLLAAGVSGGLPAAQQLLAEGPKAVKESARLQKEIAKAARGLGVTGANAAYESASQIGKGLAAGLRASLKPVVAAMRDIARALIATLRKELGLKPGEGLGGLLGGGGGGGGAGGGGAGHHRRHHKPPDMRMLPGGPGGLIHPGGPPMIMHPGSGGPRGGPPVIHTHITVQLNGMQVGSAVQTSQLRHARRNIATGIKLPSRAA